MKYDYDGFALRKSRWSWSIQSTTEMGCDQYGMIVRWMGVILCDSQFVICACFEGFMEQMSGSGLTGRFAANAGTGLPKEPRLVCRDEQISK